MAEQMAERICEIIFGLLALLSFVISWLQFREKGVLLNNAYLYASPEKRKTMDKTPHYRQSAIIFLLLGFVCAFLALGWITERKWLNWIAGAPMATSIVYAVVSSVRIEKKK